MLVGGHSGPLNSQHEGPGFESSGVFLIELVCSHCVKGVQVKANLSETVKCPKQVVVGKLITTTQYKNYSTKRINMKNLFKGESLKKGQVTAQKKENNTTP